VSNYDDEASPSEAPWLRKKGIDLHRGDARIEGPGRITVGGETIETDRIALRPAPTRSSRRFEGLKDVDYWTSREGTSLTAVPESVIVLGGGPCRRGAGTGPPALRRAGAIVEGQRLLAREGEQAGAAIAKQLASEGIDIHVGCTPSMCRLPTAA